MDTWQPMFQQLLDFVQEHGHDRVSAKTHPRLAKWVSRQRSQENTLLPERKQALTQLGFRWKTNIQQAQQGHWIQQCQALRTFTEQHGHSRIPADNLSFKSLRTWVDRQRRDWEKITPVQRQALLEAGFLSSQVIQVQAEQVWEKRFSRLTRYGLVFGHVQVPKAWPVDPDLASWVARLRTYPQRLTPDQRQRLTALGFAWKKDIHRAKTQRWEERYLELVAFHQTQGHCRVPDQYPQNPALGKWVSAQRLRQEMLTSNQKQKLKALAFAFTIDRRGEERLHWFRMFGLLKAFYRQHGHPRVPENWPENKSLSIWVGVQRQNGDLLADWKRKKLDGLGFAWRETLQAERLQQWEARWEQLQTFHAQHGHCRVTLTNTPHPQLFHWVTKQRRFPGRLSPEQLYRLKAVGFQWPTDSQARKQAQWEMRLTQLKNFQHRYGHCQVPEGWAENPALARWVAFQRKQGEKLLPQRKQALQELGFVFRPLLAGSQGKEDPV